MKKLKHNNPDSSDISITEDFYVNLSNSIIAPAVELCPPVLTSVSKSQKGNPCFVTFQEDIEYSYQETGQELFNKITEL